MIRRAATFAGALVLATVVAPLGYARDCGDESTFRFEGWRAWARITEEPIVSPGHSYQWVDVLVDELAEETYQSAGAPYPECATVIKPIYGDQEGDEVLRLTVMVKMPAGYDPQHGDWWYGVYDAAGVVPARAGRLADCIRCHEEAADTDYLFSREVTLTLD